MGKLTSMGGKLASYYIYNIQASNFMDTCFRKDLFIILAS